MLVGLLALGLRIAYVYQADESPLFDAPMVDARTYVDDGLKLVEGGWSGGDQPFWQPPLYPYFLAALFTLGGESYYLPRVVQAVVGAGTCVLLFFLGCRAFSPSVGCLAGLMAALYGPFIYFEGELLPVGLALCLDVFLLLALLWAARGRGWARWLLAGFLLGLSGLTVANVFLFAPVVVLWATCFLPLAAPGAGRESESRRLVRRILEHPRFVHMSAFLLGLALVVAPVTLRNRIAGGEWVLVSYNAGVNFFIGNNPDYDETVRIRPGRAWLELVNTPETEAGITGRSEGSAYFFARSWEYIASDPVGYVRLMLRKLYFFFRGEEIPRNLDPYFARNYSAVLEFLLWKRGLAFPFGVIAPLALLGLGQFLASRSRRTPAAALVVLFTATYILSVVLFFVTTRYRLPAVPCLLLFAAHAVVSLGAWRGRRLVAAAGVLALLLAGSNAGAGAMDMEGDAYQHYWMGVAFAEKGMKANARREYRHAVRLDPSHEEALFGLLAVYAEQQRYVDAVEAGRQLLRHYPDRDDVRMLLADLSVVLADYPKALELYEEIIPNKPDWAALHGRHAYASLMAGKPEQAAASFRRTLELKPDSVAVRYQLARLYHVQGKEDRAVEEYSRLLRRDPGHVDAMCHLAELYLDRGIPARAETLLTEALAARPGSVQALRLMAWLKTKRGRYGEALRYLDEILTADPDDYLAHGARGYIYAETGREDLAEREFQIYERGMQRRKMRQVAEEETRTMAEAVLEGSGPGLGRFERTRQ